jgi:hypothetical protein
MEKEAINVIRDNDINVSRFLRFSLRSLHKLILKKKHKSDTDICFLRINNKDDLKKYSFLMEDIK